MVPVPPEPAGPTSRPPVTDADRYAADDPDRYAADDPGRYDDLPAAAHTDQQVDGPDDPAPPWEHPADATAPWDPPLQRVPPADAALVAQLDDEVRVVDGHPRYHLLSCAHLIEREHEPLPVFEAISLGFTPCGLCNPDTALLADTYPR